MVNGNGAKLNVVEKSDNQDDKLVRHIERLKQLTIDIVSNIADASHEEMLDFIEQRDKIIIDLQKLKEVQSTQPSTGSSSQSFEREIKDILAYDTKILAKLSDIQAGTTDEITKSSVARKQRNAYDAAYTIDGVYFDKKK